MRISDWSSDVCSSDLITAAMGLETPWQIRPHHLNERQNATRSDSIDRIYNFYPRGILLDAPDSVASARYWAMARADSFRAAIEGTPEQGSNQAKLGEFAIEMRRQRGAPSSEDVRVGKEGFGECSF